MSVRLRRALTGAAARVTAQEVWGREALARIVRALPPIERAYATIRSSITRPKPLRVLDLMLPDEGRLLDIGCGFGLFAAYFAQTAALDRLMVGFDEPLAYRHHTEGGEILRELGFRVRVPDILPHPHVVIAATKAG